MGHNPTHDGLDALFRRMGGDKKALVKYKRNQEKEGGRRSRSHRDFDWPEGYYVSRQGIVDEGYQRPRSGLQPLMNNFQNTPLLMPLRRPNGLPNLIRPGPLYPSPQAQPGVPSNYPSAAVAPPGPPWQAPTQAPSQHEPSSAKLQSSQRVQSSQREPPSYSTLEPPPTYKTMTKSSSQRPQGEASSQSTIKPSSQSHRLSERPSGTPTKAVQTEHYKLGGMQRTIVEGQVASSSPSTKTGTVVSKSHNYELGKMERTVEGQVPGSKTKRGSER